MQNVVQFSFQFLDFECRDAYDADAYKGVKTGSWQKALNIQPYDIILVMDLLASYSPMKVRWRLKWI
jgi:hypothetical protein